MLSYHYNKINKVIRFSRIYGLKRTLNKIYGRTRRSTIFKPIYFKNHPEIGLIGCGQFQFSTIAYFLSRGWINKFLFCFDTEKSKAKSLARYYSIPNILLNQKDFQIFNNIKLVYIASNHASHATYAIYFLNRNINVFCEKPISVDFNQFEKLTQAITNSNSKFYAGYNRPYSPAILKLKEIARKSKNKNANFTLNYHISAHDIPDSHWYRNPEEGTRICGNVGHWIDLMTHIYNWRGFIPKRYKVQIAYSNILEPDDNITISITTLEGDLTSITITSRTEPFEGINETINFQYDTIIAKIDDFRKITIWNEHKIYKKRYFPKNIGHKRSVMQPFKDSNRALQEVISSTELMLYISEMVKRKESEKSIVLNKFIYETTHTRP